MTCTNLSRALLPVVAIVYATFKPGVVSHIPTSQDSTLVVLAARRGLRMAFESCSSSSTAPTSNCCGFTSAKPSNLEPRRSASDSPRFAVDMWSGLAMSIMLSPSGKR